MHFNYDAARLTAHYPMQLPSFLPTPPPPTHRAFDDIINIYNNVTNAMRRQTDKLLSYFKVQFVYNRVTIAFPPPPSARYRHAPLAKELLSPFLPVPTPLCSLAQFPHNVYASVHMAACCLLNVHHVSRCSFCIIKSICRSVSSAPPATPPKEPFAVCVWSSN